MKYRLSLALILVVAAVVIQPSHATAGSPKSDRGKVLAFDDPSLVEGVNRQPFDSLSQLGNSRKNKKQHLYRKRTHFPSENRELMQEMTVSP